MPRRESAPSDEHARSDDLRATAAAVEAAARVAGSLQARAIAAARDTGASLAEAHSDYDILVPVFNAPDALKRCLDSLIANTDHRHAIHVLDDASTDSRVAALMQRYVAKYPHVRHYRLPSNLGFPGTVNAGLASTARDVVLVNSDTEFPPGCSRLDRCRRSDPRIHAVSPLSNNASICSVPHQNQPNDLPARLTVAAMDELVQRTSLRRYPRSSDDRGVLHADVASGDRGRWPLRHGLRPGLRGRGGLVPARMGEGLPIRDLRRSVRVPRGAGLVRRGRRDRLAPPGQSAPIRAAMAVVRRRLACVLRLSNPLR